MERAPQKSAPNAELVELRATMKYVLSPQNRQILTQFAKSNVLLAFDYDGTLSPIVENRDCAPMRRRTKQLLHDVCTVYPCAIISGRARRDVVSYVSGIPARYIVGNHGIEPSERMSQFSQLAAKIRDGLTPELERIPGLDIEDKRYSLSVHYRRSRQPLRTREDVLRVIRRLAMPIRIIEGKHVFNILPKSAPNKGEALQRLRTKTHTKTAIYIGDDVTDEDVFALNTPETVLGIRVGCTSKSRAAYYIRTQLEIDEFLMHLFRVRAPAMLGTRRTRHIAP